MLQGIRGITSAVSVLLSASLVVGAVVVAAQSEDRASTRAYFNDGGAWVANSALDSVAHMNRLAREFSGQVDVGAGDVDVFQAPGVVAVHDRTSNWLALIDESRFTRHPSVAIPEDSEVFAEPGGLVIVDPASQSVYRLAASQLVGIRDLEGIEPLYDSAGQIAVAVGPDGLVVIHDVDLGTLESFGADGGRSSSGPIPPSGPASDLTLVGSSAVLHFRDSQSLVVWGVGGDEVLVHEDPAFSEALVFQQPGVAANSVVAVDESGRVVAVDLEAGAIDELGSVGPTSIDPIVHRGCVFAVTLEGGPALHRVCPDGQQSTSLEATGDDLRLRLVNGWIWVSDTSNGAVWITSTEAEVSRIDDWSLLPSTGEGEQSGRQAGGGGNLEQFEDPDSEDADVVEGESRSDDGSNRRPVAEPDEAATRPGRPVVIPVLDNDTDPDGDVLVVDSVEGVAQSVGWVRRAADGLRVEFTPAPGHVGRVDFDYTVSDGRGGTATGRVTVEVVADDAPNRPPETGADVATIGGANSVSINVLDNDRDPDGDAIVLVNAVADVGRVEFSAEGRIRYLPDPAAGDQEIAVRYVVKDERGAQADGVLRVLRIPGNQKPSARDDVLIVRVGQTVHTNVLHNDSDPDGDPLMVTIRPEHDEIFLAPDGTMLVTASEMGVIHETYGVSDGEHIDRARIRIDVLPETANQAPVALRDDAAIARGETRLVPVLANDLDPDGDVLAITDYEEPDGFVVQLVDAEYLSVTATPTAPGSVEFLYFVSDGEAEPVAATVVVTVVDGVATNQTPVARPDTVEVRAGRSSVVRVLDNDFDPDGDQLRVVSVDVVAGIDLVVSDDGASVRVVVPEDRRENISFSYEISDGLNSADSVVEIRVIPPEEPNRAPIAVPDEARTKPGGEVDTTVTANDRDPDGDLVRVDSILKQGEGGTATVVDGRTVRYEARRGFSGTDSVVYTLTDGRSRREGVLRVGVIPEGANRDPTARDDPETDQIVVEAGSGPVNLEILSNDSDPDGDDIRVLQLEQPDTLVGSLTVAEEGQDIAYTPPEAIEEDSVEVVFGYVITDGRGGTARAQVRVTVVAVNNVEPLPPVAGDATTPEAKQGAVIQFSVAEYVDDPDGEVAAGTFSFDSPGVGLGGGVVEITVGPESDFTVSYTFTDEQGLSDGGVITVVVNPDLPPTVEPINETTEYETAITIDIMSRASDPEGLPLVGTCCEALSGGGTSSVQQGEPDQLTVTFVPDAGFSGSAGFTFTLVDQFGNTVSGTVNIEVMPDENTAPTARDDSVTLEAGTTLPYDLRSLVDDVDLPEDEVTVADVGIDGTDGVTLTRDGWLLRLAAAPNAVGETASISYTVRDRDGETASGEVSITVEETSAPPPEAADDTATTKQGDSVSITVTDNDIAFVGSVKVASVGPTNDGVSRIVDDDSVEFTPAPDFVGRTRFTYTIEDETERQAFGTVNVFVVGRPGQPAPPTASAASGQSKLSWSSPAANGAAIEEYEVEHDGGTTRSVETGNSYRWEDLTNGVTYRFRVRARNEAGWGEWSAWSQAVTPDRLPDAPGAPDTTIGDGQIQIGWSPPPNEGSDITRYEVAVSGQVTDTRSTAQTSLTWTGLENGSRYCFRVRAANALGVGDWSTESCQTPVGRPDAPAPPTAVGGDRYIDLSWAAPDDKGGAVTGYEIDPSTGDAVSVEAVSSYRWANLTNGVEITFRIRARNRAGWGPWSEYSSPTTPTGRPGAARVTATASTGEFSASWTANDNGSPITRWVIDDGGLPGGPAAGATRHTWSSVSVGTYTITAQACNSSGECGPEGSTTVEVTEVVRVPGAVTVAATGGVGEFSASWSAEDNGSPITRWVVDDGGLSGGPGSTARNYTWTGVSAGSYTIRVRACNAVGCGDWGSSTPVTVTEEDEGPALPPLQAQVDASGGVNSVSASWSVEDNGSPITQWRVRSDWFTERQDFAGSVTQTSWSSVPAGTHTIRIRACSSDRCGPWGEATVMVEPPEECLPGQAQVDASGGVNSVSASWSAVNDCSSPITRWVVDDGGLSGGPGSTARNYTWTGVSAGSHTIRVRACNAVDCGPVGSSRVTVTEAATAPGQAVVTASGGVGEFSASWSAEDNGSPITRWVVDDGGLSGGPGSTARNYTWTGVSAGSHTIRVRACNAVDCGPVGSSRVTVTEAATAPGQAVVTASGGVGEFSASWSVADDGGSPITRWIVYGSPVVASTTNYTWTDQRAGTYTVPVQACNAVGCGPEGSDTADVDPVCVAPERPTIAATGGVNQITASWSADDNDCSITRWVVDDGGLSGGPGSTARNYTWTGVSAGSHTIRVRACNAVDCGPVGSSRVTVTEAATAPGQAVVTASGGVGELSASWSAEDNGSPITRWVVDDGGLSGGPGSTARNYTWTGVSAGSYTIRVRACNAVDCGDWGSSTPVTVTEEDEGPALPPLQAQVDASGGVNSVSASWSVEDNGSPITQWRVRSDWFTERQDFAGSVTQTSWSSVPAGTHTIRIRACSSDRCGPWGEATVMVEPPEECLPGQAQVDASGGVNSVSASWSAVNDCSSPITRWVVDDGGLSGGPGSTARNYTWTGVSAGSHTIRVRACNAVDCGPVGSSRVTVTEAATAPGQAVVTASGGVGEFSASWSAEDNGSPITRWVVDDGGLSGWSGFDGEELYVDGCVGGFSYDSGAGVQCGRLWSGGFIKSDGYRGGDGTRPGGCYGVGWCG